MKFKKLTITITTYNRKKRLLNQLSSIFSQEQVEDVQIIVLDNHSDYDIDEAIKSIIPVDVKIEYKLIIRPYNIESSGNISTSFMYCETEWMWLLADDDYTPPGAIKTILEDIETYSNVSMFKYSIDGFCTEDNLKCTSISTYLNYYKSGIHSSGSMIFMSNNVFNVSKLYPYLGKAIAWNCTNVSHLIPILFSLSNNDGILQFRNKAIVKYVDPELGTSWNYATIALGLSNISYLDLNISRKQHNLLCKLVVRDFNHRIFILKCLEIKTRHLQVATYNTAYKKLFRHVNYFQIFYKLIFYFLYFTKHYMRLDIVQIKKLYYDNVK